MTGDYIREHWEEALDELTYGQIASRIEWGFTKADLETLAELHKNGIHRNKIEDLLEDCNFHYECGNWHDGNSVIGID